MEWIVTLGIWALISLSMFNGLALFWLGLTIYLTAEERRFGPWLILTGMALAGLFFLSHTVILADQLGLAAGINANVWWNIGWLPIIIAPLLWYMLILWYSGFRAAYSERLRWNRYLLAILSFMAVMLVGLHIFTRPLPSFDQIAVLDFSATIRIGGVPIMFILFPPYAILCVLLPIHGIRHPSPARHAVGSLARQRAQPSLMRTALFLLAAAVMVAGFVVYAVRAAQAVQPGSFHYPIYALPLIAFDLGVTAIIAGAIVSLGQAVTAYEVFTGKTLPRHGFARQWYAALGIAALISIFIGFSLLFHANSLYALVVLAMIAMLSYALFTWRAFVYRDQIIANLRPFVSGRSLLRNIIDPERDPLSQAQGLFESMCERFLTTSRAQITPDKALSMMVVSPLIYPPGVDPLPVGDFDGDRIQQLENRNQHDACWLIPLWSERGRIGVMLLGEKVGGGLYTEEEMQAAQSAGERILDMFVGEVMAQHLVRLQRRRITDQRIMDFQTRRTLHDRSLPALHEAILALSIISDPAASEVIRTLSTAHKEISNLIHSAPVFPLAVNDGDFLGMIRNSIRNEFSGEFEVIHWQIPDRTLRVEGPAADILYGAVREVIRNSAVHGRGDNPKRTLSLWITVADSQPFYITIRDDGVGPNGKHNLTEGTRSGLALHGALMALMGGFLSVDAADEGGTIVRISL